MGSFILVANLVLASALIFLLSLHFYLGCKGITTYELILRKRAKLALKANKTNPSSSIRPDSLSRLQEFSSSEFHSQNPPQVKLCSCLIRHKVKVKPKETASSNNIASAVHDSPILFVKKRNSWRSSNVSVSEAVNEAGKHSGDEGDSSDDGASSKRVRVLHLVHRTRQKLHQP